MSLQVHGHPLSSYCQKVLIAFHENATPFEFSQIHWEDATSVADFERLWPLKRMPVLRDGPVIVRESTIIIEYLALHHPGPVRFLPASPAEALEVRFMDRFFDNYVMAPMQRIVGNALRPAGQRNAQDVNEARAMLDTAYAWLDQALQGRTWAAGSSFTLADCAAAPSLFYADWTHPVPSAFSNVRNLRSRLLQRPSFARVVDEARPYRHLFPLGAPDRD